MRLGRVRAALAIVGLYCLVAPIPSDLWFLTTGLGAVTLGAALVSTCARKRWQLAPLAAVGAVGSLALAGAFPQGDGVSLPLVAAAATLLVARVVRPAPPWFVAAAHVACLAISLSALRTIPEVARVAHHMDAWLHTALVRTSPWAPSRMFASDLMGVSWLLASCVIALLWYATALARARRVALVLVGALAAHGVLGLIEPAVSVNLLTLVAVLLSGGLPLIAATAWPRVPLNGDGTPPRARVAASLVCASLLVAISVQVARPLAEGQPVLSARVAVVEAGLQDWGAPAHGAYGTWSGGMFGLLERHAARCGDDLRRVAREELTPAALSEIDRLVFINLNEYLSSVEIESIHSFLLRGGECLVLADHTDVAGLMGPTNQLCGRYGLRVKFDSAKSLTAWSSAAGRSAWGGTDAFYQVGLMPYGVGASLSLTGEAVPLLSAALAFSDRGERMNLPGAFLGNYALDPGEMAGGVVLVGGARVGDGSVVLVGDTTPFQNSALARSYEGSVRRLLFDVESGWVGARFATLALFACIALALLFGASSRALVSSLWLAPVIALASGLWLASPRVSPCPSVQGSPPVALFVRTSPSDLSRGHRSTRTDWQLARSAQRSGFVVQDRTLIRSEDLADARVVVLPYPLAHVSDQAMLLRYVSEGGSLLIIGGPRHASAIQRLLRELGVKVGPEAVGSRPLLAHEGRALEIPHLVSAYQIRAVGASAMKPLIEDSDMTFAAHVTYGRGTAVVIADEAFSHGSNLEGQNGWHLGNLAFMERLWNGVLTSPR